MKTDVDRIAHSRQDLPVEGGRRCRCGRVAAFEITRPGSAPWHVCAAHFQPVRCWPGNSEELHAEPSPTGCH